MFVEVAKIRKDVSAERLSDILSCWFGGRWRIVYNELDEVMPATICSDLTGETLENARYFAYGYLLNAG